MDHRGSSPPWTGLHCRSKELIRAQPVAAPGHGGLPRLHGKDEELVGVQFRASPKTEVRRGDLVTAVALGESDAQAWRAGKESRGRGGGGRQGSSLFIVAEGGGAATGGSGEGIAGVNCMKWLAL
jgi:hypothetical protein